MRPAGPAASSVEQQPRMEEWGCAVVFIYFRAADNLLRSLRPRWLTLPPPVPKRKSLAGGLLGRPFRSSSLRPARLRPPHAVLTLTSPPPALQSPCTPSSGVPGLGDLPYHLVSPSHLRLPVPSKDLDTPGSQTCSFPILPIPAAGTPLAPTPGEASSVPLFLLSHIASFTKVF